MNETTKLKKLYNAYSPFSTNNDLYRSFAKITANDYVEKDDIRAIYNEKIMAFYINEAVVKGAFIKYFSFKKSPKLNTTIFELPSNNSRVDLCLVNSVTKAFEIKTEYDSLIRLDEQINDYLLLFEYLYIIVSSNHLENLKKFNLDNVGIISYQKNRLGNLAFTKIKESKKNDLISPIIQLQQLSKTYLLELIKQNGNFSINKNDIINDLLYKYSKDKINQIYKNYLKNEYQEKWQFVYDNKDKIHFLDYQWFFKNNMKVEKVYI